MLSSVSSNLIIFFFICFLHGNNCTLMYLPIESLSKVVIHTYMIPNAAPNNNRRTQKGTKMNCVVCNSPVSVIFISHSLDWEWWCCLAMPRVLYRLSPKLSNNCFSEWRAAKLSFEMSANEQLLRKNLSDCVYSQYAEGTCRIDGRWH